MFVVWVFSYKIFTFSYKHFILCCIFHVTYINNVKKDESVHLHCIYMWKKAVSIIKMTLK